MHMKEVLEQNKYWMLTKEDNRLSFATTVGTVIPVSISIHVDKGCLDKNQHHQYIEYSWNERKKEGLLFYENGKAVKFQNKKIIIDSDNYSILYAEKETSVYDNTPNVYKIIKYDNYLSVIENDLVVFDKDTYNYQKICSLNSTTYYHTCNWNNNFRVICQNGSDVKIISLNSKGIIEQNLVINDVEELYRLTRNDGNVTYLFSFFVLKTKGTHIILNLKNLLCIEKDFMYVTPTSFSVKEKDFLVKNERFVIKQGQEYLCIDNTIYDEELNKVTSIRTKWDANPTILDIYDCFIAVSDFRNNIHILKWIPSNEAKIEESYYVCKIDKAGKDIGLIVVDEWKNNNCAPFYPIKKKFVVDIDSIRYAHERKVSVDYDEHDDYSIMDTLDGEPDAYWNID